MAGERADVSGCRRAGRARAKARQEHRPRAAAGDQPRQQPGAARAEEQPVDVAALGARPCALGGDVEILDVQAQDLVGAGGGLVEQQGPMAAQTPFRPPTAEVGLERGLHSDGPPTHLGVQFLNRSLASSWAIREQGSPVKRRRFPPKRPRPCGRGSSTRMHPRCVHALGRRLSVIEHPLCASAARGA